MRRSGASAPGNFRLTAVLCLVGFALHFGGSLMPLLVIMALVVLPSKLITDTLRQDLGKQARLALARQLTSWGSLESGDGQ